MNADNGVLPVAQLRERLQVLLDDKEKQLQMAGTLGQRILAQQMELEERVNQLSDTGSLDDLDGLDGELSERLRSLANTLQAWDHENAELFTALGIRERSSTPLDHSTVNTTAHPEKSISRHTPSAAQSSRRAKNAAHRADDVEFAFEIGSGLLTEVRRLQSLLGERDKALQDLKEEKDDLDRSLEALRASLLLHQQNSDKYKEENWNLEVALQEARQQNTENATSIQRLENEHKRLTKQLTTAREWSDKYKNDADQLTVSLSELKSKHETDIAQMRKNAASLQRDKSDLQSVVEDLKAEAEKKTRVLRRHNSPAPDRLDMSEETDISMAPIPISKGADDTQINDDIEGVDVENSELNLSYLQASGLSVEEVDTLKQNFAHAQRQISALRNSLQKERELRMEMKRKTDNIRLSHASLSENQDGFINSPLDKASSKSGVSHRKRGHHGSRNTSMLQYLGKRGLEQRTFSKEISGSDSEHDDKSFAHDVQYGSPLHSKIDVVSSYDLDHEFLFDEENADGVDKKPYSRAGIAYFGSDLSRPSSIVSPPGPLAAELGFVKTFVDIGSQTDDTLADVRLLFDAGCQTEGKEDPRGSDVTQPPHVPRKFSPHSSVANANDLPPSGPTDIRPPGSGFTVVDEGNETEVEWQDAQESLMEPLQSIPKIDALTLPVIEGSGVSSASMPLSIINGEVKSESRLLRDASSQTDYIAIHYPIPDKASLRITENATHINSLNTELDVTPKIRPASSRSEARDSSVEPVESVLVDRNHPPTMILPPPPKIPPPSLVESKLPHASGTGSMLPPARIPDHKTHAPTRPSSPPPRDLIQRASTPSTQISGQDLLRDYPSKGSIRHRPTNTNTLYRSASNQYDRDHRHASMLSLLSDGRSSNPSRRSSMSSDHYHFRRPPTSGILPGGTNTTEIGNSSTGNTDSAVIHAITQTMIGEFLFKYTRNKIGKGYGEKRHRRYFWVHPYTKTLYWSSSDPGALGVAESNAKSAFIESVRSVLDPNPMPPGLYQYSVVITTPQREMKVTAPTKERHDIWFNALQFLLSRPGSNSSNPGDLGGAVLVSPSRSNRTGVSKDSSDVWNNTPKATLSSQAQLSPAGSMRKRPGTPAAEYLRWGNDGPTSPSQGFDFVQLPAGDDLDFEIHADDPTQYDGYEGLENVRTCCNGAHIIGRHPQGDHLHHVPDSPVRNYYSDKSSRLQTDHERPVSPSGWSFRSKGGMNAQTGGIFTWGRGRRPSTSQSYT